MKKYIILVSLFLATILSAAGFEGFKMQKPKFLSPQEAFKVDASATTDGLKVQIRLGNKIHIYKNKLKVKVIEPIKKELPLNLPKGKIITGEEAYEGNLTIFIPKDKINLNSNYKIEVDLSGCSDAGICYAPQQYKFDIKPPSTKKSSFFEKIKKLAQSGNSNDIAKALQKESLFFILTLFFIVGLLLALTPCILPMVPILSSILLQQAGASGNISRAKSFSISLVYVVSMALMYAIIGVIAGLFNFDLQANANNPWVIVPVSIIFIALALSLFGYFEIALPSSWQTKLNKISDSKKGSGYFGVAIMGAISSLIVGACTAPVISGAIIFISATGDATLGGLALFVMGIGAGVPLLLIGLGAKNLVPKPGGWMENVSKFFAFLMLIMALYVARGLINPTLFMITLAAILAGMSLYFGAFEKPKGFIGIFKVANFFILIYAILIFIGALNGAKSIFDPLSPFKGSKEATQIVKEEKSKSYTLNELLKEIKSAKKPVVVDIGKENCAACTELATITFPNPKVKEAMKRFKFIQLDITKYTDDDREIMKYFNIFGAPNLLFFNSKGEPLKDKFQQGFVDPDRMVEILNSIK